jgi:hypothetical protein
VVKAPGGSRGPGLLRLLTGAPLPHAMPLDFRLRAGPGPLPLSPLEPRGDRTSSSFMRGGVTWGRVVVRMSPGQST